MPEYLICSNDEGLPRAEYKFRIDAPSAKAAIALFNPRIISKDRIFSRLRSVRVGD
jgi:hypothetical protein